MNKIHVILVVFLCFFFLNAVNFESYLFSNKNIPICFQIFHYTQTKY